MARLGALPVTQRWLSLTGACQQQLPTLPARVATGRPIPLLQVRVVDPAVQDVARDGTATGEVVARAP